MFAILVAMAAVFYGLYQVIHIIYDNTYHNDPADYYPYHRLLTEEELRGLKRQFPKEVFRSEVYLIEHEMLMLKSYTSRGPKVVGGYSYYKIGELKVELFYLSTPQLIDALNRAAPDLQSYTVIKGKHKNYVIDINGVSFFEILKKDIAWFDCWDGAYNADATAQRQIRILGQREATASEVDALTKTCYQMRPPRSLGIGMLLLWPLVLLLLGVNAPHEVNIWFVLLAITVIMGIVYCFFIHNRLFPCYINKINIIEGRLRYDKSISTIFIGDFACNISSPVLLNKLLASNVLGQIKAVEVTQLDYYYTVVNIEGISHINDFWQGTVPNAYYTHYLISAATCLLFVVFLYFGRLQGHLMDWMSYKANIVTFCGLILCAICAIAYSGYCMTTNKRTRKRVLQA